MDDTRPGQILVVDDEPTIRHLLKRWIARELGAEVVEAENGLQGLELIAKSEVDLVITDINMPVLDGIEMLSLVRADPLHSHTEIIVSSVVSAERRVKEAIELGVTDYLLKPLQFERTISRLQAGLRRAMTHRKSRSRSSAEDQVRVLIADPDPNFCEFACSALEGSFSVKSVRTPSDVLVQTLRWNPDLILVSPEIKGLRLEFLIGKVHNLAKDKKINLSLLTDAEGDLPDGISGAVPHLFVPDVFLTRVMELLTGEGAPDHGLLSWLGSLDEEIYSAVRQVMGMMTGAEASKVDQAAEPDFDLFGHIELEAESGEYRFLIGVKWHKRSAKALVAAMMGGEAEEIDDESRDSGIQEILNVVGGRIKNSCEERNVTVRLGLPHVTVAPPASLKDSIHDSITLFRWGGETPFELSFSAVSTPSDASASKETSTSPPIAG